MDNSKKVTYFIKLIIYLSVFIIAISCGFFNGGDVNSFDSYYIIGSKENRENLIELFGLFQVEKANFQWMKLIGLALAVVGIVIFKWEK